MLIRIWGARGSIPSPLKPAEITDKICRAIFQMPDLDTSDMTAVRAYVQSLPDLIRGTAGGNTSCVEIRTKRDIFIIDAGSGLRELGLALMDGPCGQGEGRIHLFFSHPHWDHVQGFPFFRPAFIKGNQIKIYSVHDMEKALIEQQRELNFPVPVSYMQADIEFVSIEAGVPFQVNEFQINTIENMHPGKAYSYRFEDEHSVFVYANDAEYKQLDKESLQPYIDFFRGADALAFDAQYTLKEAWQKVDWGHSSAMIGVDMARAAGVKRLLLFHHEPTSNDQQLLEIQEKAIAYQAEDLSRPTCQIMVAYEGLSLDLTPSGTFDMRLIPDYESAVLTPRSTFDALSIGQLDQKLDHLVAQNSLTSSIIDLSQVETLTTNDLKALVAMHRTREATQIVLASPAPAVRRVIELNDYSNLFAIYPSVQEACSALEAREAVNLPGHLVEDRYQIIGHVGEGRLGTTLKAKDIQTDSIVAVKILSPTFSEQTIEQFLAHTQKMMDLKSVHIVEVYAAGVSDTIAYVVEEFIEGVSLEQKFAEAEGPLDYDQALNLAFEIAKALDYAHTRGVLHSDLKPHNIFLTDQGVKLCDLGLGRLEEGHNLLESPLLFLTADYLAPEQIYGQPIRVETDLYALGVVLYRMFTGQLPYEGDESTLIQAHISSQTQPQSPCSLNPEISTILEHVILKLLAKNPDQRYQSARQVKESLSSLMTQMGQTVRQRVWPLFGREKYLRQLLNTWDQVRQGSGRLTLLHGEQGVGKTALALRVATLIDPPIFLLGQCQPWAGGFDFQPFRDILRTYLSRYLSLERTPEIKQALANLAPFLPDIETQFSDLPQPTNIRSQDGHQDVAQIFMEAFTEFAALVTVRQPWLLILDDLQWADSNTISMLNYLTRHLTEMRVFIIGNFQFDQFNLTLTPMEQLDLDCDYDILNLSLLSKPEVEDFLTYIWEQDVPEAVTQKIYQHTSGNPYFVEEMAKELVDDGLITVQDGAWHFSVLDNVHMPENLREALWRHTRRLKPDTQRLLRRAAILGPHFRFEDLRTLARIGDRRVLQHLDMALEHHLIQEYPGDNTFLTFSHSLIRIILDEDFGIERQRELHRDAGVMLEVQEPEISPRRALQLAFHFREAEVWPQAINYGLLVARNAYDVYAKDMAQFWFTQAHETLEKLMQESEFDPFELAHLQLLFAEFGITFDATLNVFPYLEQAIQTFQRLNAPEELALANDLMNKVIVS
ncbi:MAG: protein kinase [Chloroflexota bacterium]